MRVVLARTGWLAKQAKTNIRNHEQVMRMLFSSASHMSVAEERNILVSLEGASSWGE